TACVRCWSERGPPAWRDRRACARRGWTRTTWSRPRSCRSRTRPTSRCSAACSDLLRALALRDVGGALLGGPEQRVVRVRVDELHVLEAGAVELLQHLEREAQVVARVGADRLLRAARERLLELARALLVIAELAQRDAVVVAHLRGARAVALVRQRAL